MDCIICIEKFNKTNRSPVVCPFCRFTTCRHCYQKYCLERATRVCMNQTCKKVHSVTFFRENISKTFYNVEWRDRMKEYLFDIEQAQFPQTLQYISNLRPHQIRLAELRLVESKIATQLAEIRQAIDETLQLRNAAENENEELRDNVSTGKYNTNIYRCPTIDCRGLVRANSCCICRTQFCKDCRQPNTKSDDHKCDQNTVASIKLIKQDTKPCPTCSVLIQKLEGCSTMWCVNCHKGFDWKTGSISEGPVHNPEYFRWLQEQNFQNIAHIFDPCDDDYIIDAFRVNYACDIYQINRKNKATVLEILRCLTHFMYHIMPIYDRQSRSANSTTRSREVRMKYLESEITKEQYIQWLVLNRRKVERLNELLPIYRTLINISRTLVNNVFRQLTQQSTTAKEQYDANVSVEAFIGSIKSITDITNEATAKFYGAWKTQILHFKPDLSYEALPG